MAQSQDVVAECPTCKAVVPLDATECPQCGELFDQEVATGGLGPATVTETDRSSDKDGTEEPKTGFREKFLFYTGIFLILLGGPGIALGSWLHDVMQIGVGEFRAFDVFGPWNRLVTAIGLIVLIVGIVCLILSLRFSRPSDVERDLNALRESWGSRPSGRCDSCRPLYHYIRRPAVAGTPIKQRGDDDATN